MKASDSEETCEYPKDSGKRVDSELKRQPKVLILSFLPGRSTGSEGQTDQTYKLAASLAAMLEGGCPSPYLSALGQAPVLIKLGLLSQALEEMAPSIPDGLCLSI